MHPCLKLHVIPNPSYTADCLVVTLPFFLCTKRNCSFFSGVALACVWVAINYKPHRLQSEFLTVSFGGNIRCFLPIFPEMIYSTKAHYSFPELGCMRVLAQLDVFSVLKCAYCMVQILAVEMLFVFLILVCSGHNCS